MQFITVSPTSDPNPTSRRAETSGWPKTSVQNANKILLLLALPPLFYIIVFVQHDVEFRWIAWNLEHATGHGCTIQEIESVVRNAGHGWPRKLDRAKHVVEGRGGGNRIVRVIYLNDPEGTFFVIHAMPLTTRRQRRRR